MSHGSIRLRDWLVVATIAPGLLCGSRAAPAQTSPAPPPETVAGEKLGPGMLGPGTVETMDQALARDAARPLDEEDEGFDPDAGERDHGTWVVPERRATYFPHSGVHNVVNASGDTRMGIAFPGPGTVDVIGAWFAGQAGQGAWTTGIQIVGFRAGKTVASTDWFHDIGREPKWFEMNLKDVDRIEIVSVPVLGGCGWYAMDDLTYAPLIEGKPAEKPIVIDFEDVRFNQKLTGTSYAGLTWERGAGEFKKDQAVPGPTRRIEENNPPAPPAPEAEGGIAGGGGSPPALLFDFQGVIRGEAGQNSFPPDTCGAIGPNHFVEVVNRNFSVYNRVTGVRVINISLGSFLPGGNGDPRVIFDHHSGRWIVIDCDFNTKIFLAVSATSDAEGSWFKTSFVASAGSDTGFFPDYPTLGVDANGIYIACTLQGLTIFALNKAPLVGVPQTLGTITAFRNLPFDGCIQPCVTYGTPAGEYCISRSSTTTIRLRRVDPPLTAPTLTTLTSFAVPINQNPPDAPAQGSGTPLDTLDARPMNAVYRDGFIWCAQAIDVGGRAAVRWYKLDTSNSSLAMMGTIDDPVRYYFDPGIAVNANGEAVVGFTGSSANEFASAYYTGRAASDPSGQMAAPILLKAGAAPQNNIDGFGRNRWGDYSLTTLDPNDEHTLWTIQEYAHATNIWGTWIAKLAITPVQSNDNCANAIITPAGAYPFATFGATTDGPNESICNFNGSDQITNDIWFYYPAQCDGTATVSLCGSNYDSKLAVYGSTCPAAGGTAIACDDSFCGDDGQVTFPVTAGAIFRIRVGGRNGAVGTGTMVISCTAINGACCMPDGTCQQFVTALNCQNSGGTYQGNSTVCAGVNCPPPCFSDIDHNHVVNVGDMLSVINNWGPCPPPCPPNCAPDINHDCVTNSGDLLAVINAWGPCP